MRKLFFITIPALLIFLVAVELCLRLGGYVYEQQHRAGAHAKPATFKQDEFRILCLGDSNTFGMGADPEGSYPRQLERLLQKNVSGKIKVINGGRLANTSSLLLKRLQEDIDQNVPAIIIVLVGVNNGWNLEDSSYFLLNEQKLNSFKKLEKILSSLRIYKLFKIGLGRFGVEKDGLQPVSDRGSFLPKDQRSWGLIKNSKEFFREGKNDLAVQKAKEAVRLGPTEYMPHLLLAETLRVQGDIVSAKAELWEAIRSVREWNGNIICAVTHQFQCMRADDELVLFKKYLRQNLEKKQSDALIQLLEASMDLYENQQAFKAVLRYDLEQIVERAKQNGVRLVLQTYPRGAFDLDDTIREVSRKYDVAIVDQRVVFKGKPLSGLFAPDGHCNEKGYQLMAENIYQTLTKNEMLPAGIAGTGGRA